jgi:hypothetical protein
MTKFIDTTKGSKEKTKTVFTHIQRINGWEQLTIATSKYLEIKYLGKCSTDGDMFACYYEDNSIHILKGTKGSEFD